MNWITDHDAIDPNKRYIVCAIAQSPEGSMYLYHPQIMLGWQFKRLMAGCYAALEMPPFTAQVAPQLCP